ASMSSSCWPRSKRCSGSGSRASQCPGSRWTGRFAPSRSARSATAEGDRPRGDRCPNAGTVAAPGRATDLGTPGHRPQVATAAADRRSPRPATALGSQPRLPRPGPVSRPLARRISRAPARAIRSRSCPASGSREATPDSRPRGSMSDALRDPLASDRPGELVRDLRRRLSADELDPEEADQLRLDLARALWGQSRYREASRELEILLAGPGLTASRRLQAMGVLSGALLLSGRPDEARGVAEETVASPDADPESRVLAKSAIRALFFLEGRYEAAVREAAEIVEIAVGAGPVARAEARIDMGGMLMHADEFDKAARWLMLEDDATPHQREEATESLAWMDLHAGRWDRLLERVGLDSAEVLAADRPDLSIGHRRGLSAHALFHRDQIEHARRELESIPAFQGSPPVALVASALLAEAANGPAAAAPTVERIVTMCEGPLFWRPQLRVWGPELVRLAVAARDQATASRATRALAAAASVTGIRSVHGAALAAQGMLDRDPKTLGTAL